MSTRRIPILAFGVLSYALFFATFLYAIGFVADIIVPKSLDSGPPGPWPIALAVDLVLLMVFALQHSIMARPAFKRWLTRFVPLAAERSVYVLASSLALILLFRQWQPIGVTVWDVGNVAGRAFLVCGAVFGWLAVLGTTFVINHFDLFGLRQVWREFRGLPQTPLRFVTPAPYRLVRHPLYVGWLFAFWFAPTMTVAHLVFAIATTVYILIAIRFEERDLADAHPEYTRYRQRVPMLVPRLATLRVLRARVEAQGFTNLDDATLCTIEPWLRVAPAVCLVWTATGTMLASPFLLGLLAPIALTGAIDRAHPFDFIYNHYLRHRRAVPRLPVYRAPRRFACVVASVMLLGSACSFAVGDVVTGQVLGWTLVAAATVTVTTGICIASYVYRGLARLRDFVTPRMLRHLAAIASA